MTAGQPGPLEPMAEQHEWWRRQISRRTFLAGSGLAVASAAPAILLRTSAGGSAAAPVGIHLAYGSDPTTQMAVTWQLDLPVARPYLRLGTSPGRLTETVEAELDSLTTSFPGMPVLEQYYVQARATSLQPDTTYYYVAGHEGSIPGSPLAFRTAPRPGTSGRPFTFTAFADQSVGVHARAVDVLTATQRPAFHLLAGDIAYADENGRGYRPATVEGPKADVFHPGTWNQYLSQIAPLASQIPWMVAMGNHDMEALYSPDGYGGQVRRFAFPGNGPAICPTVYSFSYENVAFLAVDANDVSYEFPANLGYSGGQQTAWIEAELSRFRQQADIDFIVVFLHQCAYSTGPTHGSDGGIREHWSPLFDRYQVDLVINGHNHVYERTDPIRGGFVRRPVPAGGVADPMTDGTTYLTVGGGGRGVEPFRVAQSYEGRVDVVAPIRTQYWTGINEIRHQEVDWSRTRYAGYSLIAVDVVPRGSGRTTQMTVRALDLTGIEIDRVTLQRTAGQVSSPAGGWSPADELSVVAF